MKKVLFGVVLLIGVSILLLKRDKIIPNDGELFIG